MVTGANPTPHTVPEFLTGRPLQSLEPLQHQNSNHDESQDTIPQIPETTAPNTSSDPINRLAEVLVGMNNRPSAQTLMVRPVSTTTLTFENNCYERTPYKLSVTSIQQTDKPWKTSWLYFVENTSNPKLRRPPNTNGTDWCLTETP